MIGMAVAYSPDYQKGRMAAINIFKLLDRKPKIDTEFGGDLRLDFKPNIHFSNVEFTYPSRLKSKVLKKVNFLVEEGQTVALVGSSGSGKSTCIQLLLRFYDTNFGNIVS